MAASQIFGIVGMADIGSDALLADLGRDAIVNVVNVSLAEHNAMVNQFLAPFGELTSDYKRRLLLPGGGKLQASDENGRARPRKGTSYDVALPILQGGDAWGSNYVTLQKMSVERFGTLLTGMLNADFASVRDLTYSALFTATSWTFADPEYGDLVVKYLANGDTDTYPTVGSTALATDTHLLAQAATIADANNPFPTIRDELLEHGSDLGDVIAFIPPSIQSAVEGLTEFTAIPNDIVVVGNGDTTISRRGPKIPVPGQVIGYLTTSRTWIVVHRTLPTGYLIAVTENGPRPLAFRQDKQAALQGFHHAGDVDKFPFFEDQWIRRIGAGAWNRVGAVALYFGTSASYTAPSGYSAKSLA